MRAAERDAELLRALVFDIRIVTAEQVAATWWNNEGKDPVRFATKTLDHLTQRGLLEMRTVMAHPMLELDAPVARWTPGEDAPDLDHAAKMLAMRWTRAPVGTNVFRATRRAANLFGGRYHRLTTIGQETHDLHVSELYVRLRRTAPERAVQWMGEDAFAEQRRGQKLPDAVLVDAERKPVEVIEFGGAYDVKRVRAFHQDCESRALPYELW